MHNIIDKWKKLNILEIGVDSIGRNGLKGKEKK